jgi:hypothetical protein
MGRIVNNAIPNLINGVSQQPETLRLSSQATAQENGYSSVVEGLRKRPPTEFVKKIKSSTVSNAFIHTINRDANERYVVIITDDNLEVYTLDGVQKTVVDAVGSFGTYIDDSDPKSNFEAVTIADYTFIINKNKTTALSGSASASRNFEAVYSVLQGVANTKYAIKINGTEYSYTTTDDATTYDATNIATELVTAIGSLSGFTITNLGTDIVFENTSDFTIAAIDGYGSQGSQVIKGTVNKFSDLPKRANNGHVVEVVGEATNNFDNYFVKYESANNNDVGVWRETVKPGIDDNFDTSTMPHLLIRTADGNFRYTPADGSTYTISSTTYTVPKWNGRVAGDEETSPHPEFIGQKISDIFFFRNRLGFISGDNVFMSRAGGFFDLHPETVTTVLDTDPIDIAVSHTKVATLRHAIPFDETLLIFSDQSQFILGGGQTFLSPKNVNINVTTEFEASLLAKPVGAGGNVFFPFTKGNFSGVREFFVNADADKNDADDITGHVPKYVPKNIFKMAIATNENILVALSSEEQNALYVYQYYVNNRQKLQSAWSKWTYGNSTDNKILNVDFIESELYILMQNSDGVELLKIETAPAHTDTDATYLTHLDRKIDETTTGVSSSYSSGTGQTTITLPYTIDNTLEMVTRNVLGSSVVAGQKIPIVTQSIDTFTGALVASATVNGVNLEDGDFTFAVQSRNDQLSIKLINDSHLPSNFVSAEWQAYYNTTT